MSSYDVPWEQWIGTHQQPIRATEKNTRTFDRDRRTWIRYNDILRRQSVTIEMPTDAPTKACDTGKHDRCKHRLGGQQEAGVLFTLRNHRLVHWRCGCPCHNRPMDIGQLF